MTRLTVLVRAAIAAGLVAASSVAVLAQAQPAPATAGQLVQGRLAAAQQAAQVPAGLDQQRAEDLRNEFRELMRQYPPALSQVLRLDTSLIRNAEYLSAYPALTAFLQAHPEVVRYPDYFLSFVSVGGWQEPLDPASRVRLEMARAQQNMLESLLIAPVVAVIVGGVLWLVRLFIGHRRWLRATRIQSELNNRLLERFGTSEQLLAYLQSQPGHQLAAVPAEPVVSPAGSPFVRILRAVQAGLVLSSAGIGLLFIKSYFIEEAGLALLTLGVLALSLGAGFAMAAYASYMLSQRFGLIDDARSDSGSTRDA